MVEVWVVEGLDDGLVTGSSWFVENSGKTPQTVSHSFSFSAETCFWSAWKEEVVNLVRGA